MPTERLQDHSPHDWLSPEYVQNWVANDITKDEERRPILTEMLNMARLDPDKPIRVLDIGAGYGFVTGAVLEKFPYATVTLQDYSAPMLEHAGRRLAEHEAAVRFVCSDLREPAWTDSVGGPYDLAVSAIAIHTIGGRQHMAQVYRSLYGLLAPGGVLLNCDYDYTAPSEMHEEWLREAGFDQVKARPAGREHLFILCGRTPS